MHAVYIMTDRCINITFLPSLRYAVGTKYFSIQFWQIVACQREQQNNNRTTEQQQYVTTEACSPATRPAIVTESKVSLRSPNSPFPYSINQTCQWILRPRGNPSVSSTSALVWVRVGGQCLSVGFWVLSQHRISYTLQLVHMDVKAFATEQCCDKLKVYNSTGKLITFNAK